jgi:hypothetical protein
MATFNFDKLKKNRSTSLDKLSKHLEELSSKGYSNPDEGKYWKPTIDKAGNGSAIIRFLPAPEGEDIPFVRLWTHGFKGPGGQWYIENCLSTLGQDDPINEFNSALWSSNDNDESEERKQARRQKRKLNYISNVYVVSDPGNPDNDGKTFLFKYGKKIFDKIVDARNPEFEDETPIEAFDLWDSGANFRIKIRKVDGYPNYDRSEFEKPGPLFKNDDDYERKITNIHSLKEVVDPKNFKSYDELKAKLYKVLGLTTSGNATKKERENFVETAESEDMDISRLAGKSVVEEDNQPKISSKKPVSTDDDDDDLEFFKSLTSKG